MIDRVSDGDLFREIEVRDSQPRRESLLGVRQRLSLGRCAAVRAKSEAGSSCGQGAKGFPSQQKLLPPTVSGFGCCWR
jgi:hypothetical protein